MKKNYVELEIEVMLLSQQDILTMSDEVDKKDDPYGESGWWN